MKTIKSLLVVLVCESFIFSNLLWASEQLSLPSPDITAPEVTHNPITDPVMSDSTLTIQATVTDNVGVKSVTLFYRVVGDQVYQQLNMKRIGWTDTYSGNIEKVPSPGIEYFIQAEDTAGNTLLHGYSFSPLTVKVQPSAATPELATVKPEPQVPLTVTSKKKSSSMKWVWIGVGVLALGALAAGSGSSGGDTDQGTVVVSGPTPQ